MTDSDSVAGVPAAASDNSTAAPRGLTPHATLKHVVLLLNPLSGSVGPHAEAEARAIFADYALQAEIRPLDGDFDETVAAAFERQPDAVFVLAGDGTAR
ncbi:MAG: diacylglycerol kinase family lipid kinase, partial [Caulobacterales bacterium]|nr:diacylglycerol kinase family lipid kinase [Caulobacterales bacterium]